MAFGEQTIKGIDYATFPAAAGSYVATYPAPAARRRPAGATGGGAASKTANVKTVEVLTRATRRRPSRA